jgi:hypothetical protein
MRARAFIRAFAVALIFCGCANESREGIKSIWINGKTCPICLENLSVQSDGLLLATDADSDTRVPSRKYAPAIAKALLDEFPLPDLQDAADRTSRRKRISGYATSLDVFFHDGRQEYAAPIDGRLEAWAEMAAYRATRAFELRRWTAIAGALRQHRMRFIKLEMLGCFGTCPAYDVTFRSNGTALLHVRGFKCEKTANAVLAFRRVTDAAYRAGSAYLRPVYSMRAVDTEGARITLATQDHTYVSEGPDSTTWGPAFLAAVSRFDQLVRDATWLPRLDVVDRC